MRIKVEMPLVNGFLGVAKDIPLWGQNQLFLEALYRAAKFAGSELPILIVGETGTGKELLAQAIHLNSPRAEKEKEVFAINCGTFSKELFLSELFGHVKGAFTDAIINKVGLFERADGKTLLLDEVGDIPYQCQVSVLRAFEQQECYRVGSTTPYVSRPRLISIANGDLLQAVMEGRYRADLYFRLAGGVIELPPLRQRKEDISFLADRFLARENPSLSFAEECYELFLEYSWPGNIRELENIVRAAAILAEFDGRVLPEHIKLNNINITPKTFSGLEDALDFEHALDLLVEAMSQEEGLTLKEVKVRLIQKAADFCGGNRRKAMKILGISSPATVIKHLGLKEKGS